jgi:cystathionine gamma-lyase
MSSRDQGPSTRAIHAGIGPGEPGGSLRPGPVMAAPFHLRGDVGSAPYAYARDGHPTFAALEAAIGALDGGECVSFASGMAAVSAVVLSLLRPGDVLVASEDGYPGIRQLATEHLVPSGIHVRMVPTETKRLVDAAGGATLVWVETPSNPGLYSADLRAVADAAHNAGALLAVDNTLATPLGMQPLALGADLAVVSGTKLLTGHSDMLLGAVSVGEERLAAELRRWRSRGGAIPGAFEAWLAHRSLATLGMRLERSSANALAVAEALRRRNDVLEVRHPAADPVAAAQMTAFGPLVGFTLGSAAAAQSFLDACELVAEATSFGGIESTAERRARWGTDAVPEGFIRFSAGCEDADDLVADVLQALDSV